MKFPRWTKRLLDSTRGQVILLLRKEPRTVADLAAALGVTDNAIRAHLATLERDGLVHQRGEQAGFRKPHFSYELTKEAEELFPKAYAPVLSQLIAVMKDELGVSRTENLLAEVGRRMAPPAKVDDDYAPEAGLERALKSFASFGGQDLITREAGKVTIVNAGCPLSVATEVHPEVCQMMAALLTEVAGTPVRCACQQQPGPQCRFEIEVAESR